VLRGRCVPLKIVFVCEPLHIPQYKIRTEERGKGKEFNKTISKGMRTVHEAGRISPSASSGKRYVVMILRFNMTSHELSQSTDH